MRWDDIFRTAWLTIRQQRGRTALSLVGVVIGSLILIFSLAAQSSVSDAVMRVFSMGDQLRRISISQGYGGQVDEEDIPAEEIEVKGKMSAEKRRRIRQMLISQWQGANQRERTIITQERLDEIRSLDHVAKIIPNVQDNRFSFFLDTEEHSVSWAGEPSDHKTLPERIVVGSLFESNGERGILIHEFLAYQCGAVSDQQMQALVGKRVRLEFRGHEKYIAHSLANRSGSEMTLTDDEIKALNRALDRIPTVADQLPLPDDEKAALLKAFQPAAADKSATVQREIAEEFTIRGVFRGATEEEEENRDYRFGGFNSNATVILPIESATRLYFRLPGGKSQGVWSATVTVDHEDHLRQVSQKLEKMGLREHSLINLVEHIQEQVVVATWVFAALAGLPLFVAGVGITNTMIMSVTERTHEIGVMKAVGARDRHILLVFLVEGAMIGILGAVVAVAIGWGLSYPIDYIVRQILEREIGRPFDGETVIFIPLWLTVAVPAFCGLLTMLASVIPARRAGRLDPVTALRHE